jgi:hypothetical protein
VARGAWRVAYGAGGGLRRKLASGGIPFLPSAQGQKQDQGSSALIHWGAVPCFESERENERGSGGSGSGVQGDATMVRLVRLFKSAGWCY